MAVKMVPTVGVVVIRDGNRVVPEIGKAFAFETEERDAILEAQPNALRKPKNEDEDAGDEAVASSAEAAQVKAKGGKKKATANKSDEEAAQDEDL